MTANMLSLSLALSLTLAPRSNTVICLKLEHSPMLLQHTHNAADLMMQSMP
jgi:hypothetical protein